MKRFVIILIALVTIIASIPAVSVSAATTPEEGEAITCPKCGYYPFYPISTADTFDEVYQTCVNSPTGIHFHQLWYHQYDYYCMNCNYLTSYKYFFKELCEIGNFSLPHSS